MKLFLNFNRFLKFRMKAKNLNGSLNLKKMAGKSSENINTFRAGS